MKVNNVSNTAFNGIMQIKGNVDIFKKDRHSAYKKISTTEDLEKNYKDLKKVFSGSSVIATNLDRLNISENPLESAFSGTILFDTDRVDKISPSKIYLYSPDGNTFATVKYNDSNSELRQLLAINAYKTADDKNITVELDEY